jgi:immune inhibitor A
VWLWDTSQSDNNTIEHPGSGLILPVDAHASPDRWDDGSLMRNRLQTRDATFSWYPVREVTLHNNGEPTTLPAGPGVPYFDDHTGTYWDEVNPRNSVQVPDTGTRISILSQPHDASRPMTVMVGPSGA